MTYIFNILTTFIVLGLFMNSNNQAQAIEYSNEKVACMAHKYMEVNGFHGHEGDKYHPFFQAYFMMDFVDESGNLIGSWSDLWKKRSDYVVNPVHRGIYERTDDYVIVFRAQFLGKSSDTFCITIDKQETPKPYMGSFGCRPYFGLEALDSSKWELKFRNFKPEKHCPSS